MKKSAILLVFVCQFVLLNRLYAQGYYTPDGWQWVHNTPWSGRFIGVSAITLDRVYVYGTHGMVLLTADQGDNFKQIVTPESCIKDISWVSYSKSKNTLCVACNNLYFFTSDDGKNWVQSTHPPDNTYTKGDAGNGGITVDIQNNAIMRGSTNLGSPGGILNPIVSFSENENGFITGYTSSDNVITANRLYYTINSGNFWTKSELPNVSPWNYAFANGLNFVDKNTGFMMVGGLHM